MHSEDTPKGGHLTPIPAPSRILLYVWGSNHACVTSGLDTLGADFLTLDNNMMVEESQLVPLAVARGGLFVCLRGIHRLLPLPVEAGSSLAV